MSTNTMSKDQFSLYASEIMGDTISQTTIRDHLKASNRRRSSAEARTIRSCYEMNLEGKSKSSIKNALLLLKKHLEEFFESVNEFRKALKALLEAGKKVIRAVKRVARSAWEVVVSVWDWIWN